MVECAGLENRYGLRVIGGSNPPLSVSITESPQARVCQGPAADSLFGEFDPAGSGLEIRHEKTSNCRSVADSDRAGSEAPWLACAPMSWRPTLCGRSSIARESTRI